jgi:hypothetical protein
LILASAVVNLQLILPPAACSASFLPGRDLRLEGLEVWHSSIEALSTEYTQFDLRHVEPAAMLGRVVDLELVGGAPGLRRLEGLIQ